LAPNSKSGLLADLSQVDSLCQLLFSLVDILNKVILFLSSDANVEFSVTNAKMADSSASGLIEAFALGSTKLTARAMGPDRLTGKKVAYRSFILPKHIVTSHSLSYNPNS